MYLFGPRAATGCCCCFSAWSYPVHLILFQNGRGMAHAACPIRAVSASGRDLRRKAPTTLHGDG